MVAAISARETRALTKEFSGRAWVIGRYYVAKRLRGRQVGLHSAQKPLGELREALVALALGALADFFDERPQFFLSPVVTSCTLGTAGVTCARALEQSFGSGFVVRGIAAIGKGIAFPRVAPAGILLHECARHIHYPRRNSLSVAAFTPLSRDLQMRGVTRDHGGLMREESYEEQQEDLDPHRREERDGAALENTGRLAQKGVLLTGRESSAQLDDLMTAVERFEGAVIARGGDLFVNTPFSDQPEDPRFVIPQRLAGEDAEAYAARINEAADQLERADF